MYVEAHMREGPFIGLQLADASGSLHVALFFVRMYDHWPPHRCWSGYLHFGSVVVAVLDKVGKVLDTSSSSWSLVLRSPPQSMLREILDHRGEETMQWN